MWTGWKKWALIVAGAALLFGIFMYIRKLRASQSETPQEADELAAKRAEQGK